jgi:hypothetical protein
MVRMSMRGWVIAAVATIGLLQTAKPNEYELGAVTVVVPPPDGFESAMALPGIRERFPEEPQNELLAIHMPAAMVAAYKADQDVPFYTKLAVPRSAKTRDIPLDIFNGVADQMSVSKPSPEQLKLLDEVGRQRGMAISAPINAGVFDRTPQSVSTLLATGITIEGKTTHVLVASSLVRIGSRVVSLQAIRMFETGADRTAVQDLAKAWVRKVVAANP